MAEAFAHFPSFKIFFIKTVILKRIPPNFCKRKRIKGSKKKCSIIQREPAFFRPTFAVILAPFSEFTPKIKLDPTTNKDRLSIK